MTGPRIWTSNEARILSNKILQGTSLALRKNVSDALASLADQVDSVQWIQCLDCRFRAAIYGGVPAETLARHRAVCPGRRP